METIIKKIVHFIKNNQNISNPFVKFIFNKKYAPIQKIVKIKNIENCEDNIIKTIFPKNNFLCHLPKFNNNNTATTTIETPAIALFQFENAIIDADSSSVLYNNKLLVNKYKDERYNEGFVVWHNQENAKIKLNNIEKIENGFFLGGNGSWNWYHFLVEIAPKLLLLNIKETNKLLVSEVVLQYTSMQRIIDLLKNDFKIIYLKRHQQYEIGKLFYINDFNHVQFNRFDGKIKSDGTYFNETLTKEFSEKIIQSFDMEKPIAENLFLYRKNTHRIAKNQDEILNFLQKYNYSPICLEEMEIEKQIQYFYHAKNIIGITGAAWTNLVFCRNQPNAICFIPENAKTFSVFSNLAKIFDVNMISQVYDSQSLHTNSDFTIDFEKFKEIFFTINKRDEH